MIRRWKWLVALIGATAVLGIGATATAADPPGVYPSSVTATLFPGDSMTVAKTVQTDVIPPNPDLVFLADTTGSMAGAIANVQANANTVMSSVLASQPTSHFGAASYKDFDCDAVPFSADQDLTASTAAVQSAIGTWSAGGGCDTPESQLNALTQVASTYSWRPGSSRVIAWFGDAWGHDPSNGATLTSTITALQAQNIRVIAISTGFDQLDFTGQASAIASATGGTLLHTGDDVAAAILSGLENLPATVAWTKTCDPGIDVTLTPASQTVASGDAASFSETISVDPSALGGVHHCTVSFTINGVAAGPAFDESIAITVNHNPICTGASAGPNLWPPNHRLVSSAISGVTDPDGNPLSISITGIWQDEPTNGLGDGDTPVDGVIGTGNAFAVRAERSGTADGRVYHVLFSASDGLGGSCTGAATIGVPHDQSQKGGPVDGGMLFDSTS